VFADRAQTREAVLQVELARLEYSLPRLRRAWTHLGRQRGGGVTQRGEGEAQLELDQRMLRDKIASTKRELVQVIRQRAVSRKRRRRVPVPTASIVGYTNAGKSTLLNKLTGSDIYVADKLFATLDPTSRKMTMPSGRGLVLTDTVGFVRNLPHRLVDAFKATLEEALVADFLIHVVDLSSGEVFDQMETTLEVLDELGIVEKKIITVFNKVDLVDDEIERASARFKVPDAIFVSATTGEGLEALTAVFEDALREGVVERKYLVPHDRYDLVARLRRAGSIRKEESNEDGVFLLASPVDSLIPVMEAFRSKDGL
jgi:GTP-binding protein HflX